MYTNIKILALSQLNKTGFFKFAKILTKNKIRILCYHRFGDSYVTSQWFEEQIKYLKNYYNVIDLNTCLDFLYRRREASPNSVLITVDDGYQDFYNIAFPILRKFNVSATLFLTVDFIDKGIWLWHDLLNFGIIRTSKNDFKLNGKVFDLKNRKGKAEFKLYLDGICTYQTTTKRDEFISQILKELDITVPEHPTEDYTALNWSQIIEMSKFGINFGSHTCTHPILSKIVPNKALEEIKKSKNRIEEVTQRDTLAFSYPNGKKHDFNEEIEEMVKQCGYTCSMSMIYGMNDSNSDKYALRRLADRSTSFIHFVHDVSGFGVMRSLLRPKRGN